MEFIDDNFTSYNNNHGWGRMIAESLRSRPRVGKVLIVAGSGNVNWEELNEIFPPTDKVRVLTTLSLALTEATASQDDAIFIAPYHTEDITAAAGIAMSKAGVSVIGLGSGTSRPTFTWTTAVGASWDVSAADCLIENCLFDLTGVDAVTAGFNITAANCHIKNCEFETADSAGQCVLGILTNASANGFKLENNYFKGSKHAGTSAAVRIVGGNDHKIIGNTFIGAYTTTIGAVENLTTAVDRTLFKDNFIWNTTALSTKATVWQATSTVIFTGQNNFQIYSGDSPITAAIGSYVGLNSYARVVASSVLIGTTSI